jgi:hypothetical protein
MAQPVWLRLNSLAEFFGPETRKARPGGCAFSVFDFYTYYIKLLWVNRHKYRLYFCLRMSQLREIEGVWGLDKVFHRKSQNPHFSRKKRARNGAADLSSFEAYP